MSESLDSQIITYPTEELENVIRLDVETVDSITPIIIEDDKGIINKVGRKRRLTEEKYLNAVRRLKSTSDSNIGKYIGMDRTTVYYFRKNNPISFEKGQNIIANMESKRFDTNNLTYQAYSQIPIIQKWIDVMEGRPVSKGSQRKRLRVLYNVCRHLNIHPENLTLEKCAELVVESKKAYYADRKFISGLAYLSIRKPVRSWFQLIHGVSGEYLTSLGIGAESSKGSGSQAKERVLKEQRERLDLILYDCVYEVINNPDNKRFHKFKGLEDIVYLEMKGIINFMYYTATRIGATNPKGQGSLSVRMNNPKHILTKKMWKINLIDKGEKGGIEWNKMIIDDGLIKLKEYISERFQINIEEIETKMKTIDSFLFPSLNSNYKMERMIMNLAHEKSGVTTKNPNHIWRHTFAQDFLHASDWNYELCASIGGWMDTGTLKKHYGEMSEDAKERGLKKAMGLPVEDVTYELRW